ncbi:MAG: TonB-dependent receptor [Sphingomonadales bacterium]|nr:TonB-dependent receptor [Sphingomonadales bacterium]MBD3772968.1 TonB-dependent receptor [Paracoccaceae bacterium]
MSTTARLAGVLFFTTALTTPSLAFAQDAPQPAPEPDVAATDAQDQADQADQEDVEVSIPGGGGQIVVTGRKDRNIARSSDQVVSVLSTAEIARTGEGNIAGALGRVTGLSVVGNGYVYVRGLGDRYSLALLNGSSLPSPEPLKRVVPLDLFPTGVIASSLVQKSYSVNYPGEFGGGVINLTTTSTPNDPFFKVTFGISGDTETTGNLGYTYYGSDTDWLGYDNGNRDAPPALKAYFASGQLIGTDPVDSTAIARELVTSRNGVVQRMSKTQPNYSVSATAGKTFTLGSVDLGVIAAAGYSNKWLTRDITQQSSQSSDLSSIETDFRQVSTDQRVTVNGLLGFGLEFGDQKIRWTNVYIHDTIKKASLALGQRPAQNGTTDFLQQRTAFYERQLFDTQLVGEFKLTDALSLDVRGSYANTKRKAPGELYFEYVRSNSPADPFGDIFVNRLNGNSGTANYTFSDLNEDLYTGGADLTYRLTPTISVTAGGAYSDTQRYNSRRDFIFRNSGSTVCSGGVCVTDPVFLSGIATLRPDILLSPGVVDALGIELNENDPGSPAFDAELEIKAGYLKTNLGFGPVQIDAGVRYEDATQTTTPIQVFTSFPTVTPPTVLSNSYWLPAATITIDVSDGMQLRLNASKTIARPQFRELINQPYYDPDNNRPYRGNPLLQDSQLYNAEARFEWYFDRDQRVSAAVFYKKIDNPIEAFVAGTDLLTSYANAPEAQLYGAEFELQKYIPLNGLGESDFWQARRFVFIGNYTYTNSKLKVSSTDTVTVFGAASNTATDYFRDGAKMTGQSDHIVNIQLGMENTDRLSQQTILVTYASDRVVSRGLNGTPPQPDVIEKPGLSLDFVWREGFTLLGAEMEAKFEARNILGRNHQEFQQVGDNRIDLNTYDLGTTFAFSLSTKF